MENRKASLQLIKNWVANNRQLETKNNVQPKTVSQPTQSTAQAHSVKQQLLARHHSVAVNDSIELLGESLVGVLNAYNNSNFYGADWCVEIALVNDNSPSLKSTMLFVFAIDNHIAFALDEPSHESLVHNTSSLTMSVDDLCALINLQADLIYIMIKNKGIDKDKSAKPMALIRPFSDLLFGAFNLFHLTDDFNHSLIEQVYTSGRVANLSGAERFVFPWAISSDIGCKLYQIIVENQCQRSLEIGLAFGLSALFICQAHHVKGGGEHTAVDPCQSVEFESIGIDQVNKAGLSQYFNLLEAKDYDILPELVKQQQKYDFIFIDGLHMHDYVVIDYFYSDLLLEVGGIMAFDDCHAPGVSSAVAYLEENRNYRLLENDTGQRLRVYQKMAEDDRTITKPNHHVDYVQKYYQFAGEAELRESQQHLSVASIDKLHSQTTDGKLRQATIQKQQQKQDTKPHQLQDERIAIIGIDGNFPGERTLEQFWQAIIDEQPLYQNYNADFLVKRDKDNKAVDNRSPMMTSGLLEDAYGFDPEFFNISYAEAQLMDPQLRHLLMSAYHALEDAGLTRDYLRTKNVGVFIGAEGSDYNDFNRESALVEDYILNHAGATLANRLSYYFDFDGPSEIINTMCSSGAYCIYRAMQLLHQGSIDIALVGGVKINFSAETYQALNRLNITTEQSNCYSFHEDSKGYIRSEGVVTLVLTRADKVQRERHVVYGHIKSSAITYNGKDGQSMFSPSKKGQKAAMLACYNNAGVTIEDVLCIEAQGMGNEISDFVEFNSVSELVAQTGNAIQQPVISTLKPILGHMECVSALAAIAKIILSFKTRTLYRIPSLEQSTINPRLGAEQAYCQLLTENRLITETKPMLIGLNSFGASGSNVHLLLEEDIPYPDSLPNEVNEAEQFISIAPSEKTIAAGMLPKQWLMISAQSEASLLAYINRLVHYIEQFAELIDLSELCRINLLAKEVYDCRLVIRIDAASHQKQVEQLKLLLQQSITHEADLSINDTSGLSREDLGIWSNIDDKYHYFLQAKNHQRLVQDADGKNIQDWLNGESVNGESVNGESVSWPVSLEQAQPRKNWRMPLYVFDKQDFKPNFSTFKPVILPVTEWFEQQAAAQIYPIDPAVFYINDHQVFDKKYFPAVGYFEFVCRTLQQADKYFAQPNRLHFTDVVWLAPLVITETTNIRVELMVMSDTTNISNKPKISLFNWPEGCVVEQHQYQFTIYHAATDEDRSTELCLCRGEVLVSALIEQSGLPDAAIGLPQIENLLMQSQSWQALDCHELYQLFESLNIYYGPAHRGLIDIVQHQNQLRATVKLPASIDSSLTQFLIHPGLLDCAIQSCAAFWLAQGNRLTQIELPFSVDRVTWFAPLTATIHILVKTQQTYQVDSAIKKYDFIITNEFFQLLLEIDGLATRAMHAPSPDRVSKSEISASKVSSKPVVEKQLMQAALKYFHQQIANTLKMPLQKVSLTKNFMLLGLDSILVTQLTEKLRQQFSGITSTLFFEVSNIQMLAEYFVKHYAPQLNDLLMPIANDVQVPRQWFDSSAKLVGAGVTSHEKNKNHTAKNPQLQADSYSQADSHSQTTPNTMVGDGVESDLNQIGKEQPKNNFSVFDVAVIGMHGRFPGANNLQIFWQNLLDGKNAVTEIPAERWNWQDFYADKPGVKGKSYSRWGGFLSDIDKFDPLFFQISPLEAEKMDPQERIFIECCYHAIEQAGYTPGNLAQSNKVGLFAGVMNSGYNAEPDHFSIANRTSFLFDLKGPSIAIDTACASSLTAVHLALQSLYQGDCLVALAGGVNTIVDPIHYVRLSEMSAMSRGQRCQPFGAAADGMIDAEGVGVVVLKPLQQAEVDKDVIHAVIKSSAVNASGKTNGYTVPSPQAQAQVITKALNDARLSVDDIDYIEAHGTGTPLGDPIEIAALNQVFANRSPQIAQCRIGSVKSNIGHCESAAGMAGLLKVILQLKNRQLVASLYATEANPEIDFSKTPFQVNHQLTAWHKAKVQPQPSALCAGISSFGMGGANAHVIVAEYIAASSELGVEQETVNGTKAEKIITDEINHKNQLTEMYGTAKINKVFIIPLSAQRKQPLIEKIQALFNELNTVISSKQSHHLQQEYLEKLAFTLQTGREAMDWRYCVVVTDLHELRENLRSGLQQSEDGNDKYLFSNLDDSIEDSHYSANNNEAVKPVSLNSNVEHTIETLIAQQQWSTIANIWLQGEDVDWYLLYSEDKPARLSLPLYPFARERYWKDCVKPSPLQTAQPSLQHALIHPLLHINQASFYQQHYLTELAVTHELIAQHQVMLTDQLSSVIPGVIYIEMLWAAMGHAFEMTQSSLQGVINNIHWPTPCVVTKRCQIRTGLKLTGDKEVEFTFVEKQKAGEMLVCQGEAIIALQDKPSSINWNQLVEQLKQRSASFVTLNPQAIYDYFRAAGIYYGQRFQNIKAVWVSEHEALVELQSPHNNLALSQSLSFEPGLLDSVLHSCVVLSDNFVSRHYQLAVPYAIDSIQLIAPLTQQINARIRKAAKVSGDSNIVKFDIDVFDFSGNLIMSFVGVTFKATKQNNLSADNRLEGLRNDVPLDTVDSVETKLATLQDIKCLTLNPIWKSQSTDSLPLDTRSINRRSLNSLSINSHSTDKWSKEEFHSKTTQVPDVSKTSVYAVVATAIDRWDEIEAQLKHVNLCSSYKIPNQSATTATQTYELAVVSNYQTVSLWLFEHIKTELIRAQNQAQLIQILIQTDTEDSIWLGLQGLIRSVMHESPACRCQLIVIPPDITADRVQEILTREAQSTDYLISYHKQSRRYLDWQVEFLKHECIDVLRSDNRYLFQDDGTYLITGGLGGLGVTFAKEILTQTRQAKIILTGRAALDDTKQALIQSLQENDVLSEQSYHVANNKMANSNALMAPSNNFSRVTYVALDVTDAVAVNQLLQKHADQLKGIIHCAGMVKDNFILNKSSEEFQTVLAPKVEGSINLDAASQNISLDFFMLFSSLASVAGNIGQVDYACANGFMDYFAQARELLVSQRKRSGKTLVINWPYWQDGGMQLDKATIDLMAQSTGITPMLTMTGLQVFYQACQSRLNRIAVANGQINKMLAFIRGNKSQVESVHTMTNNTTANHQQSALSGSKLLKDTKPQTVLVAAEADDKQRLTWAESYLIELFATELKLSDEQINPHASFEKYGMDSIIALNLTNRMENDFGALSKTLFFEYLSIRALANYLATHFSQQLAEMNAVNLPRLNTPTATSSPIPQRRAAENQAQSYKMSFQDASLIDRRQYQKNNLNEHDIDDAKINVNTDVAIIGVAGRYPQAATLDEFWVNLTNAKDCITEVPKERWSLSLLFDAEKNKPGKIYTRWGGFLDDIDKFEPLFFNISPREAELMDPQERLFLQVVWQAFEDAAYSKSLLSDYRVGVYVGAMWGQYELIGADKIYQGEGVAAGSSFASIANRVSYFFNFNGPSIALDSMCSSSLTAIHLACEAIVHGQIDMAVAGGVNLSIHPSKYLTLSQGNFAATDGRCRSFGEGGDGYVPGEGIGVVILKNSQQAIADGDKIEALIKSSAVNHGGKTHGYTVPNPNAQAEVIKQAITQSGVDATQINYVETHGTGTALGDPVEISGLQNAFEQVLLNSNETDASRQYSDNQNLMKRNFKHASIAIGSVKSNIGHLESAAGIAALTKVLLQMRNRRLVPSLHAEPLNQHINWQQSGFYVNTQLQPWQAVNGQPLTAGISSFGAGGANAHLIVQEYVDQTQPVALQQAHLIVLSAKNLSALHRRVEQLADFLVSCLSSSSSSSSESPNISSQHFSLRKQISLTEIAYTLQVGRTALNERLAIVCDSIDELHHQLSVWQNTVGKNTQSMSETLLNESQRADLVQQKIISGNVKQQASVSQLLLDGEAGETYLQQLLEQQSLVPLAQLWVAGVQWEWRKLYQQRPKRIALPTYPFAGEHYWVKPINSDTHQSALSTEREKANTLLLTPAWVDKALTPYNWQMQLLPSSVLVFAARRADAMAIKQQISHLPIAKKVIVVSIDQQLEHNPALIQVDESDNRTNLHFQINPADTDAWSLLFTQLKQQDAFPEYWVTYFTDMVDKNVSAIEKDKSEQETLADYSVFEQALALVKGSSISMANEAVNWLNLMQNNIEGLANRALNGFFQSVKAENPQFKITSILFDNPSERLHENWLSVDWLTEFLENKYANEVQPFAQVGYLSYTNDLSQKDSCNQSSSGQRQVKTLRAMSEQTGSKPGELKQFASKSCVFKHNGVYLIVGGLKGIGLIVSEYLAKSYQANLIIIGRTELDEQLRQSLQTLKQHAQSVDYYALDVTCGSAVERLITRSLQKKSTIHGIIHCAGVIDDALVGHKNPQTSNAVLDCKIRGIRCLDKASSAIPLDFMVCFSSIAAVFGNQGQTDYAYANSYLDQFMAERQQRVANGNASGISLSINWPLWHAGGMQVSENVQQLIQQKTGLMPLPTAIALDAFASALRVAAQNSLSQIMVLYGQEQTIQQRLLNPVSTTPDLSVNKSQRLDNEIRTTTIKAATSGAVTTKTPTNKALRDELINFLKIQLGELIKLAIDEIDAEEKLSQYGTDSVMISQLNTQLVRDFGELPNTLFYENETIAALADYLLKNNRQTVSEFFSHAENQRADYQARSQRQDLQQQDSQQQDSQQQDWPQKTQQKISQHQAEQPVNIERESRQPDRLLTEPKDSSLTEIAIVGVHGRFPGSTELKQFWKNLLSGKNLTNEVPAERWDCQRYFDADPELASEGKIYCRWGGFLTHIDQFDYPFFNISQSEANMMDPQERLFMQSVWHAIEDAGYSPETLKQWYPKEKSANVGVFVGVTSNTYHLLAAQQWERENLIASSAMPWSIANRISYFFDFKGPSLPIDTACSSSLVALDFACRSLASGECQMAIVGGVNLYLHPLKYQAFCRNKMVSTTGRNCSFGAGDDGFVPAEGVGSLVLLPRASADKHGDQIYALIAASQVDHAGRSNGYSAPNPTAQANLIRKTLQSAQVSPQQISYVEAHGTGTQMGDSLEVAALTQAFGGLNKQQPWCGIGSVKSNMGHAESAAGIASIIKVLLQMKHRRLVPTLNAAQVNPDIDFSVTPFRLQSETHSWQGTADKPRFALVNGFGAGGVNACVLLKADDASSVSDVKKLSAETSDGVAQRPNNIFPLSAKSLVQLKQRANQLMGFIKANNPDELDNIAYTLQVGREPMSERLAIIANSAAELIEGLQNFVNNKLLIEASLTKYTEINLGKPICFVAENRRNKRTIIDDYAGLVVTECARMWTDGVLIDWTKWQADFLGRQYFQKLALPVYPFAKQRCWIELVASDLIEMDLLKTDSLGTESIKSKLAKYNNSQPQQLHPLIAQNTSTLESICFTSHLSAHEYYAREHHVNGQSVFPGAGFLEMACVAGSLAAQKTVVQISDIVWINPYIFDDESAAISNLNFPISNEVAQLSCSSHSNCLSNINSTKPLHTRLKSIGQATEFDIISHNALGEVVVHAEGRLSFLDAIDSATLATNRPLQTMRDSAEVELNKTQVYQQLQDLSLNYGESFQTIVSLSLTHDYSLSRLSLSDAVLSEFADYLLHPAIIDGAFQTVVGFVKQQSLSTPFLPFALDSLTILNALPTEVYVLVEAVASPKMPADMKKFNISICNLNGEIVIKMEGFYVKAFVSASSATHESPVISAL
ncbi:SDR family NAD(P)-dependent oxidoreductase [Aliikangiella maris]|uniref:SDR family NAD(P)-dependent oxidoreductase n=2 Tax=Aliikangiella maris TaxID=3162458 RepID=A0ABV3MPN0_9GAMM